MIDIYICEDNKKELSLFTQYIKDVVSIENMDMEVILSSPDPHAVLQAAALSQNVGLFFLDIDLKSDINGLTLAQRIRKLQPRCFIIFITSHSEMGFLTFEYKVEALDFILKDNINRIKTKIHECLLNVNDKYTSINNNIHKTFVINQSGQQISIDYDDIVYFETSYNIHKIILHTRKRTIEFTGQLKDLEQQLDYRFYRCHRSFVINKNNIVKIDFSEQTVYMNTGETVPVSIRMKKGLKKIMV
ncbi:MAG: response regulator transcription factor [Dorea sp.]|nr:response regulator transcription factor [Dorea sp.]